jgi:hypothetical protein
MIEVEGKACAFGHFVKFGRIGVVHHNVPIATNCLFVVVNDGVVPNAYWPRYPNYDHDLPFLAINDAIGYMIL